MKKALSIFILVVTVLVLITQVDDDLSEDAISLLNRLDINAESESFIYLHGIFANENENPIDVGKKLLKEYRKLDQDQSYKVVEYPDSEKLPLPQGKAFCRSWENGCIAYLFSPDINAEALLNEHKVLVSRANKFLEFNEYTTLSKPTIGEILPPFQYISAAERIKVITAISLYKNGNPEKALKSLLTQFKTLRRSLELQDNLIGKLVFLMKLSEVLDTISVILSQEGINAEMIPQLSQSEKSFHKIAAREFAMSYHTFKSLDRHPEFFETGGNFPGWITRILFKPNMTINAVTPIYYRLERLAQLAPPDFAKQIETGESVNPSTSKLRNYVGETLIAFSPEFDEYVAKFFDFDIKLALFNQLHHLKREPGSMHNPYYGNEVPKEINGSLCFSGPLEDNRSLRCLKVKIGLQR